jgi:hypothetical protein
MEADTGTGSPLVAFVIGGVQKAATTTLAANLAEHPRLCIALGKEAHWFDDDRRFVQPPPTDGWTYDQWFEGADPSALRFDATPTYCWWPPARARIRDYNPAMKWVLLLRDPVERAYSHWNMERSRKLETLDFVDALLAEHQRMQTANIDEARRISYYSRGLYAHQVGKLWELFPREQTLILKSDDMRDDLRGTVERVLAFVGVDPLDSLETVHENAGDYAQPLDATARRKVQALYEADTRKLESMLGWDLAAWRA